MSKPNIIPFPSEKPDIQEMMLDGKPETMLSARGVVLFHLSAWKVDENQKAHDGLRRYCEFISMHGYRGGAGAALTELDKMDRGKGVKWIKDTFSQYVQDQAALIQYMMN